MLNVILEYAMPVICALLTAVAGALGTWIGRLYKRYIDDKTKESVAAVCCKAVEQLYSELGGAEKYAKAASAISEMLSARGIGITDIEVKMLIESVCCEFNKKAGKEAGFER